MNVSSCIDSPMRGRAMPKCYSGDLRERLIEAVEGGASRRETAERFEVSVSSAVKWLKRWHESKSAVPKPRGGSVSPLEEFAEQILDLIAQQPDLTLVETVAELRKRRIRTSRSSLWRFLDRHGITLKKKIRFSSRPLKHWREKDENAWMVCGVAGGWLAGAVRFRPFRDQCGNRYPIPPPARGHHECGAGAAHQAV